MSTETAQSIYGYCVAMAKDRHRAAQAREKYSSFWWANRDGCRAYLDAARQVGSSIGRCDFLRARVRNRKVVAA